MAMSYCFSMPTSNFCVFSPHSEPKCIHHNLLGLETPMGMEGRQKIAMKDKTVNCDVTLVYIHSEQIIQHKTISCYLYKKLRISCIYIYIYILFKAKWFLHYGTV